MNGAHVSKSGRWSGARGTGGAYGGLACNGNTGVQGKVRLEQGRGPGPVPQGASSGAHTSTAIVHGAEITQLFS